MLQPINRFDRVDRPSAIRHLECNGTEDHILQCGNINTEILNTCGRYEVAGVVCQSMYLIINFYILSVCNFSYCSYPFTCHNECAL